MTLPTLNESGDVQHSQDEANTGTATSSTSVVVVAKVRPLIPKEKMEQCQQCVRVTDQGRQVVLGKDRAFTFDRSYDGACTQELFYANCVHALVEGCLQGYNATVFAYGQTGTGKTFTMGTGNNANVHEDDYGVTPRVIRHLFDYIEAKKEATEFLVRVSYLEIYNEEVRDLLHPTTPSKDISIREDTDGNVIVMGVQEDVVTTFDEMSRALDSGSVYRTTGSTLMNLASSRSHSIFTIIIEQRLNAGANATAGSPEYVTAKFHLVDLAGSERNKKTGATGARFKESININTGLLALGNVISVLADEKKRLIHVPYRESKLTRLLKDSLGGNSRTLMIACVSPADLSFEETLNTLRYANRAKNIKNKPVINQNPQSLQLAQLKNEIQTLQMELMKHKQKSDGNVDGALPYSVEDLVHDEGNRQYLQDLQSRTIFDKDVKKELHVMQERNEYLEKENQKMKQELETVNRTVREMAEESIMLKSKHDVLHLRLEQTTSQMQDLLSQVNSLTREDGMRKSLKGKLKDIASRITEAKVEDDLLLQRTKNVPERPLTAPSGSSRGGDDRLRNLENEASKTKQELLAKKDSVAKMKERIAATAEKVIKSRNVRKQAFVDQSADTEHSQESDSRSQVQFNEFENERGMMEQHHREKEKFQQLVEALQKENSSLLEKIEVGEQELQDARDDLTRDEEIFAEKLAETKKLYKANKQLQKERDVWQQSELDLCEQIEKLGLENEAMKKARPVTPCRSGPVGERSGTVGDPAELAEDGDEVQFLDDSTGQMEDHDASMAAKSDGPYDMDFEADMERLAEEKSRIESDKVKVEEEAQRQKKLFEVNAKRMNKELQNLNINIRMKEQLIRELVKNENEAQKAKARYEEKLHNMSNDVQERERELDTLRKDMEAVEENVQSRNESEKEAIRTQYEKRLATVGSQLVTLRKRQREQESLLKTKGDSDRKVEVLESEIDRMKQESENLRKKIKGDSGPDSVSQQKVRDMMKQQREAEKRIKELEADNARHLKVLKRKMEEAASLRKQGKSRTPGPKTPSRARTAGERERGSSAQRNLGNMDLDKKEEEIDREIEKSVRLQEAEQMLRKQVEKKEKMIQERQTFQQKRSALELKKMRSSQYLESSIRGLMVKIDKIDQELEHKGSQMASAQGTAAGDALGSEIRDLEHRKSEIYRQRARMEDNVRNQHFLSNEEEDTMNELDERIECLEAEIEYKNQSIAEIQKELSEKAKSEGIPKKLNDVGTEAKDLLYKYIGKIVKMRGAEKGANALIYQHEVELNDKQQKIDQLEQNIRLTEIDFDHKLTKERKEHETRVQVLLKQINNDGSAGHPSDGGDRKDLSVEKLLRFKEEQISILDKDNYYYKQTNRDLKRKLRDLMSASEADRDQIDKEREEKSRIGELNQSLMLELNNTKSYMRRQQGDGVVQSVRMSLKDLKPVNPSDLGRRPHTSKEPSRPKPSLYDSVESLEDSSSSWAVKSAKPHHSNKAPSTAAEGAGSRSRNAGKDAYDSVEVYDDPYADVYAEFYGKSSPAPPATDGCGRVTQHTPSKHTPAKITPQSNTTTPGRTPNRKRWADSPQHHNPAHHMARSDSGLGVSAENPLESSFLDTEDSN